MNGKAAAETAAVAASAPLTLATGGVGQTLISLGVGLIGVWLARIVFVSRENRKLEKPQPFIDTLPVTLAACLIAGAIIWDQELGISGAVFTGLGVGWTTVVILELLGDRMLNALRVMMGGEAHPPPNLLKQRPTIEKMADVPADMNELLHRADEVAPDYKPPHK